MPRKRQPRAKPVPHKVTHRQQAFAREYLVDHNGTQAAIRAGYSKKSAAQQASALLRLPKVIEELGKRAAPVKKRAELKAAELLRVMQLVAFGDISNLFKPSSGNGSVSTVKDMRDLGEDQVLVVGYKRGSDGSVELKFENRMRARELLMKHLGLLTEQMRLEVSNEVTPAEQEKIDALTDEELDRFNAANDVIHELLYGEKGEPIERTTHGAAATE